MNGFGDLLEDRSAGLTWALSAVARAAGAAVDELDLHAALGLPLLICAAPAERRVGAWPMFGRDVFAVEAAGQFGIRLRDLHPAEAARDLEHAAEFRQHFDASYRPLMRRALEHHQPVLAWRGWRGECGPRWGLVDGEANEGVGFRGRIAPVYDQPMTVTQVVLERPASQVYVVEAIEGVAPDPDALRRAALHRAEAVTTDQALARFGVVNGLAAFDLWRERRAGPDSASFGDHAAFIQSAGVNLWAFARFLERRVSGTGVSGQDDLRPLTEACRDGAEACTKWLAAKTNRPRDVAESELRATLLRIIRHLSVAAVHC